MKKIIFGAMLAFASAAFVGCGNSTPKADLKNDIDTLSYAMGITQSQGLTEFLVESSPNTSWLIPFTIWLEIC